MVTSYQELSGIVDIHHSCVLIEHMNRYLVVKGIEILATYTMLKLSVALCSVLLKCNSTPVPQGYNYCTEDQVACINNLLLHHCGLRRFLQLGQHKVAVYLQSWGMSSFPTWCRSPLRSLVLEVLEALVVQLVPWLLVHLVDPVVPLLDRVLLETLMALKLQAFHHVHLFQENRLYHHGLSIAQELGNWVCH